MVPKSIEEIQSIYQLGYYIKEKYQGELKPSLIAAIESVIKKASNKKQIEILGNEAHMDYIKYKKELRKNEFKKFTKTLEYMFPGDFDLIEEDKSGLLKTLVEDKELTKETIIAVNLMEKHFSTQYFEYFIKTVENIKRQIN